MSNVVLSEPYSASHNSKAISRGPRRRRPRRNIIRVHVSRGKPASDLYNAVLSNARASF
jgi:hypothetical protein